jgi:hypothetical protein
METEEILYGNRSSPSLGGYQKDKRMNKNVDVKYSAQVRSKSKDWKTN